MSLDNELAADAFRLMDSQRNSMLQLRPAAFVSHSTRTVHVVMLALIAASTGCQATNVLPETSPVMSFYCAPGLYRERPLRMALVPMTSEIEHRDAAAALTKALGLQLSATHLVNIVGVETVPPDCHQYKSEDQLAFLNAIRNEKGVEAVLFSNLSDHHAYWPPRISMTAEAVSTYDGEILMRVSGHWDAQHRKVIEQFDQFAGMATVAYAYNSSSFAIQSPDHFRKFVANQVASMMVQKQPREEVEALLIMPPPPPQVAVVGYTSPVSPSHHDVPAGAPFGAAYEQWGEAEVEPANCSAAGCLACRLHAWICQRSSCARCDAGCNHCDD